MRPASRFARSFSLVFLLITLGLLLLISILVRRSVAPLKALQEGTRRVSLGQFDHRVQVESRDEFQELATSFNAMAGRLSGHFASQTRMSRFFRSILSALDREQIVRLIFDHTEEIGGCQWLSLALFDPDETHGIRVYEGVPGEARIPAPSHPLLPETEHDALRKVQEWRTLESSDAFPALLAPGAAAGCGSFLLYPLSMQGRLSGFLIIGYRRPPSFLRETGLMGSQVADQVATALSNANLMADLDELNWGTLTALARTVDAKSPWTAGHSERVTAVALEIGRRIGLPAAELELLHRAGLLHDIGKIGVPEQVLDKPGRLTEEEYNLIKKHPREGGRILEPIRAYRKIVPLIEQHHEWYNGGGYPHGLTGDEITMGGRILAVADVFDALISDRPYRPGMPLERVVSIVGEDAGRQFDPRVVETLMEIIKDRGDAFTAPSEIQALP
jgi:putative nucleotidyltransferase with HDIG domain